MAGVKSVERAISLLSEAARCRRGLVELAEATGLPTSTAARLLATLEDVDAVRRDSEGRYDVGPTVAAMAPVERAEPRLRDLARPYLDELAYALDEAVGLSVVTGDDNVTITQVDTPRPVQVENWQGTRWPLADGPAGHAVIATWRPAQVQAFLRRHPDFPDLAQRIATVPPSGVWWSVDHYVQGLTSATAALPGVDGVALASIYAYGPTYRFPPPGQRSSIDDVLSDCAQQLAQAWQERATSTLRAG
ncbi:MAG: helix-turn-helix domain-containing protein [Ornithinimicrobium sp.]